MDTKRYLSSMVLKLVDERSADTHTGTGINSNSDSEYQQLAGEVHKPCVLLADMQLMNKYNNEIRLLSCVIDNFSKYAWAVPLKKKAPQLLIYFKNFR